MAEAGTGIDQAAKLRRFRWVVLVVMSGIVWLRPWDGLAPLWGCVLGVYLAASRGDTPPPGQDARTAAARIRWAAAPLALGTALSLVVPLVGIVRAQTLDAEVIDGRIRSEVGYEVYLMRQNGRLINNSNSSRWYSLYERVLESELTLSGHDGRDLSIANPSCPETENQGLAFIPSHEFLSLYRFQLRTRWLRGGGLAVLWFLVTVPFFLRGQRTLDPVAAAALYSAAGIAVAGTILFGLLPVWKTSYAALSPLLLIPAFVLVLGLVLWVLSRTTSPPAPRSVGE